MTEIRAALFVSTKASMFSHWAETLWLTLSPSGAISFSVTVVGEHGSHEAICTDPSTEISTTYKNLTEICDMQQWDLGDVIAAMPRRVAYIAAIIAAENERQKIEDKLDSETERIVVEFLDTTLLRDSDPGLHGLTNRRVHYETLKQFVNGYLRGHKRLPIGCHVINGVQWNFQGEEE
jgi:hypothetical protein